MNRCLPPPHLDISTNIPTIPTADYKEVRISQQIWGWKYIEPPYHDESVLWNEDISQDDFILYFPQRIGTITPSLRTRDIFTTTRSHAMNIFISIGPVFTRCSQWKILSLLLQSSRVTSICTSSWREEHSRIVGGLRQVLSKRQGEICRSTSTL